MIIISQDREDFVNTNNITGFLFPNYPDEEGYYSMGFEFKKGTITLVGFYKTEERATEVALQLIDAMNKDIDYFIMPKE